MPLSFCRNQAGFLPRARTATGPDGTWSLSLPTQYSRTLRAVARLPAGGVLRSPRVGVRVAPRIRLRSAQRVTARRPFTVSGSVRPQRTRLALQIAREGSDRRMHVVARVPVRVRDGRFALSVVLRRPALHRLRVTSADSARNVAGRSGDVVLRAVRPRR